MHKLIDLKELSRDQLIELMTDVRRELRESRQWYDTTRPNWDSYWSFIAHAVSLRGACARRKVGVVFVSKDNTLLSTGYNGRESGRTNCLDSPCEGVGTYVGRKMNTCEATHAEINAQNRCTRPYDIDTIYITATPCENCIVSLLKTPAKRIVFSDEHADSSTSKELWTNAGRIWQYFKD